MWPSSIIRASADSWVTPAARAARPPADIEAEAARAAGTAADAWTFAMTVRSDFFGGSG
jgi:hypothetical protein